MYQLYQYRATLLRVVDGATIDVRADLGFDVGKDLRLRLAGIDAPELNTEAGKIAALWLADRLPVGADVTIMTTKDRREKYGRYLADVLVPGDPQTVNQMMIGLELAKSCSGGKR